LPEHWHWENQQHDINNNVRYSCAEEVVLGIETMTGNGWIPSLLYWNTAEYCQQINAYPPTDNEKSRNPETYTIGFDRSKYTDIEYEY
jgi:hypothetical protein